MAWYECNVNEVGPAADGTETPDPVIYINLTDTAGTFKNTWFYATNGMQDQVLEVGIAAISGNTLVQVEATAPNTTNNPYTEVTRIFVGKNALAARTVMTGFTPAQHGWHFDNNFVNNRLWGAITTLGLCGGMAYTSLDYYFNGIPIPTHRPPDFGKGLTCPPNGRLHTMLYNRLLDSFADNLGKWSCIYPDLDAAIGAAAGLIASPGGLIGGLIGDLTGGVTGGAIGGIIGGILGGGLLDGLLGGGLGWIYGELHATFDCPGGGAAGMTRNQLPRLLASLDKGVPVPLALIHNRSISDIGDSHQVVAYGYQVTGPQTRIFIYDNNWHDTECVLLIDTENPGMIPQTFSDFETPVTGNGKPTIWEGLFVSDGYTAQKPTYGQDIAIAAPLPAFQLTGPTVTAPITLGADVLARLTGGSPVTPAGGGVVVGFAPQLQQQVGAPLTDSYTVQNVGEYPAHFQSLGIEVDAPVSGTSIDIQPAPGSDNVLAPNDTASVVIDVAHFGNESGVYTIKPGYYSVPAETDEGDTPATCWCPLFWPPYLVTATTTPPVVRPADQRGKPAAKQPAVKKAATKNPVISPRNPVVGARR